MENTPDLYVGLMSGTSLDGVDAALVEITPHTSPRLLATHAEPMPTALREMLLTLCHASSASFAELAAAEDAFCHLQARAVSALLVQQGLTGDAIAAIGSHGQTVEHAPNGHQGGPAYTLQLDNPSLLAELTNCRVVADFRRRDLAAGGQAAPLAPAFHQALFHSGEEERVILNLGGFANITWLSQDGGAPLGFDTGPANVLLDAWCQHHGHGTFDENGAWAASGHVDSALLTRLLSEAFFHQPPPRSTGRELFHLPWLESHLNGAEAPADVQATLAELTAASVAQGIGQFLGSRPLTLIIGGGGARNADLCQRLANHLPNANLRPASDWGFPADWIEAGAFAWLAYRRLHNLPGNLPSVTGAKGERVLGGIYAA
ncbi:anhydro-N-acetylmuramic acid kinase [Vreelandella subglaciescola]|uniref:Anhydro-N-acetylmuramic acid kinase n=1 Tax=Vreelandella subglaciescola TaxID=29571 RepID=A0A1M7GEE5_9GAMM|nr:anhydro-N-acetylmuramic acid kinase [Halomonas subglaciescola]SHM14488.1 anhydro-N-acetylmuramic acid kinase [Halomonas subglaciescola]